MTKITYDVRINIDLDGDDGTVQAEQNVRARLRQLLDQLVEEHQIAAYNISGRMP